MKILPFLLSFMWLMPFGAFLIGYYYCSKIFAPQSIVMPSLIGSPLHEALVLLSSNKLNARILNQKEDDDVPEGTILMQTPAPKQHIKAGQSVFLVVSKKRTLQPMPLVLHQTHNEIISLLEKHQLNAKIYFIEHESPANRGIGQYPKAGVAADKKNIIYISAGQSSLIVIPSFKNKNAEEVVYFLKNHQIPYTCIHLHHYTQSHCCNKCKVLDQKPVPGSIIDLKKPITIQLYIQEHTS